MLIALIPFTLPAVVAAQDGPYRIFVSAVGDDSSAGTEAAPVRTLQKAQELVRARAPAAEQSTQDIEVILAGGTYLLDQPLQFRPADGGHGYLVTWKAKEGDHPIISGGMTIDGWKPSAVGNGIWEAPAPAGRNSRQLWVNGQMAQMAETELPRDQIVFSETGITIEKSALPQLTEIQGKSGLEIEGTGYFTDRFSPVQDVQNNLFIMAQPAWGNNNWGYDTLAVPLEDSHARLYLRNALALLDEPNEWYLDRAAGKLYYKPADGTDMSTADVVLPQIDHLISISGTYDNPVRDLRFEGLQFSYTSWLGPSSAEGYANQQSGSFLAGPLDARPDGAIKTCGWGCRGFETRRNEWSQMPAAVQVSAAERVSFDRDIFAHLGQIALGIGNNDDATESGIGLGTANIEVSENVFTDLAGGAIMAGGIQREAHHPAIPAQANRALLIENNRIHKVSQDYMDNGAVLVTYIDRALILHNDISDAPYDGIDTGWGWGLNDPGGNPTYRTLQRGYYDFPENLSYTTPTTLRDVVVAYNRIHDVKKHYQDGGAIYNLSASPNSMIAENYVYNIPARIGLYLDEGSRYITVRNNVVDSDTRWWLNANTIDVAFPQRITTDNRAVGNWHSAEIYSGQWTPYQNNLILDDHLVTDGNWPPEARKVMENSGIEADAKLPEIQLN
ncbi:right-handed parallel beta-helix repeat-containing protein [Martelella sp. HB161492]|uniref:right-handed parallel beta-helix repeat-containing protein n=1 Tax=Martelella sp. HB161492 TaxID=2720726 RepID=UPI0015923968|nr:right-handed parallel beta-helix repeat-containing protein [Martelella sp. HB161492]